MVVLDIALVLSTWMCSLVAGLLFSYAILVMPGFKRLDNKSFIRAFQVTDRIIQNNHPLFLLVWLGSIVSIIVFAVSGFGELTGIDFFLMLLALVAYIFGVQIPTMIIHLPLNNILQKVDVDHANEDELRVERIKFEHRWNKSNEIRTCMACSVSLILIVLNLKR